MNVDDEELYASLTPAQAKWLTHFGRILTTGSSTTTDSDLEAPNFPFPAGYTKIDFDHLNAANFVRLADGIAVYRQNNQEPFFKHSRKMKEFEDIFDANDDKFRLILEPRKDPLVTVRRDDSGKRRVVFYSNSFKAIQHSLSRQTRIDYEDSAIARRKMIIRKAQTTAIRAKELRRAMFEEMKRPEYAWFKGASVTRFNFEDPPPPPQEQYVPDASTVKRVTAWLQANFEIKPVPLLLHVPKRITAKIRSQLKPPPLVMERLPFQPLPLSNMSLLEEPVPQVSRMPKPKSKARRALNIVRGVIVKSEKLTRNVENSFIPGYDLNPKRDLLQVLHGNIQAHRFRHVMPFSDFLDNELVFQTEGNFLLATARSPGTVDRNPRLVEEVIEIPDGVPLYNLKFYRSMNNEIVIEESALRRKKKKTLINMSAGQKSYPDKGPKSITASELLMGSGVVGYWPSTSSIDPDTVPTLKSRGRVPGEEDNSKKIH